MSSYRRGSYGWGVREESTSLPINMNVNTQESCVHNVKNASCNRLKKVSSTCFRKINAMATMKFFWIRFVLSTNSNIFYFQQHSVSTHLTIYDNLKFVFSAKWNVLSLRCKKLNMLRNNKACCPNRPGPQKNVYFLRQIIIKLVLTIFSGFVNSKSKY